MALSPEINLNVTTPTIDQIETSSTYKLDFNTGRIIGKVDKIEAIQQFIEKALITSRNKFLIYSDQYGSEMNDILATGGSEELLQTELTRIIIEALVYDERIINVRDFSFDFSQDEGFTTFTVDTIFGEVEGGI